MRGAGAFSVVSFVIFRCDGRLAMDAEGVVFFFARMFFRKSGCFRHFGSQMHMQSDSFIPEREKNRKIMMIDMEKKMRARDFPDDL